MKTVFKKFTLFTFEYEYHIIQSSQHLFQDCFGVKLLFIYKMYDCNSVETFNVEKLDFFSKPRFIAVKDHFKNVLQNIKDDENLKEIVAEFDTLLHLFESCFMENQRKTQKILEMNALDIARSKRAKSISPVETTTEDLKKEVRILQYDLYKVNNDRLKLLKEVEELKKTVDTESKMVQVHERSLESISVDIGVSCDFTSNEGKAYQGSDIRDDHKLINASKRIYLDVKFKEKDDSAETLKNNLRLLVLDLRITRQKIEELKKEISNKDGLVRKLSKDISESEKVLAEFQTKTSEISKPMELKMAKYKSELRCKREEFELMSEALAKAQLLNEQLNVEIADKESIIDSLKMKLEEMESARESAVRNTEMFEMHLARSQSHNKELISEMEILKEKMQSLKHKASKEIVNDKIRTHIEKKGEIQSQERTIENLKSYVVLRDQKLRQTENELNVTIEVLQNLRRDFNSVSQEKLDLKSEIIDLHKKLNDKTTNMKYLKEKFCELQKESDKIKREVISFARKHKQIVDRRDKFHNKYNHMKFVNSQQKKENAILGKRQEYLVKILKEKDIEIEKLLTWKRYIR